MKISLNWLRQYADIVLTDAEIADLLTDIGLEVEGTTQVESIRGGLRGLVIGEVMTCQKHPNADKLSLTTVNIGNERLLNIVCGAPNVAAGQKVVVATEGATLYPSEGEPFTIKKGKIRGEASEGMLCAEDEIGLGKSHDGIMVLAADAPVGEPYAQYIGVTTDTVLDINLTPNRSDAMGHLGVAFDVAAAVQIQKQQANQFRKPDVGAFANLVNTNALPMQVTVADAKSCPRYTGICIKGVRVGASPTWLQNRLKSIGATPINNIVDITNFVLHTLGQPLHAFDYDAIGGQKIVVQTLAQGTKFTTLDGTERTLHADDLMICNGAGDGLCIAGVFGGQHSGVKETTTNIFLESAHFNPTQIRRTSMRHNLRTDAATRFEKTTDANQTLYALQCAVLLILELAGGEVASPVIDLYPAPVERVNVSLLYSNIDRLLGLQIPHHDIQQILGALDMEILKESKDGVVVSIPTNKIDVTREADVIEEILRIYGYNRIETPKMLSSVLSFEQKPNPIRVKNTISDLLASNGFNEMMATSMTQSAYFKNLLPVAESELVYVNNTSNQHLDVMRPTMLLSGLEAIIHNQNRQHSDLKLFEFGKIYTQPAPQQYSEVQHLAMFLTGEQSPSNWLQKNTATVNFYTLKAFVELILQRLGIAAGSYQTTPIADDNATWVYGLSYHRGKQNLVSFGRVQPSITVGMDIKQAVFYADFQWETILKIIEKNKIQFRSLPKFPSVRRDLAMVVDKQVKFAQILEIAQKQGKKLLKETTLFDVFDDAKYVGEGKKSYAVSFVFQDEEKTLRDQDIEGVMGQLMNALEQQVQAVIRK